MELKVVAVALKQKTNSKDSTEYLCGHNLESIYLFFADVDILGF